MNADPLLHSTIDVFAVIVGILGLVALFIEPTEKDRRKTFLKLALVVAILIVGGYLGWESYQAKKQETAYQEELKSKEEQVARLLCGGDTNYEELYTKTSLGFSDKVLNDAIDDMMQNQHKLVTDWPIVHISVLPDNRAIPVRLFHVDPASCQADKQR